MPQFLVETSAPRHTSDITAWVEAVSAAADQVSGDGPEVCLLSAIFVPEDETCFYLYRSSSARAVCGAMTLAGLRVERISEAVSSETKPSTRRLQSADCHDAKRGDSR